MTLIDRETLNVLNPIFKLSRVQILWDDEVDEVEKNGEKHKRICLISTTGIYIIKKKCFPHPAKITSSIIISDLATISVVDDKCTFMSSHTQITIQHKNACMFASVVYCIRKAQYPPSILPLTITFPNDDSFELINENSPYQPSSLFIDRVITCGLHLKVDIQTSHIQQIQSDLKITDDTFIITKSIAKSPLFGSILISLPYATELHTLIIDSCQLSSVFRFFNEILLRGKQINKIVFNNCDFTNSLSFFKQGVTSNGLFKPSIWMFNSIQINESFSSLFDSLTLLNCDIKSLSFNDCTFSNETMTAVFQSILFNSCFHHLEFFGLNGTTDCFDLPLQTASLTCCSWVIISKCLHFISLSGCNIDAVTCIPQLLNSDGGLTNLALSGSHFLKPLSFSNSPVLNHLSFLDLRETEFTSDSLMSLFEVINKGTLTIDGLDLSALKFQNEDDRNIFFTKIENLSIDALKTLVFDDNQMDAKMTSSFSVFLSKLKKNLRHLDLNNSVDVSESSDGAVKLLGSLKSMNLVTLSLRSEKSSNFSFGSILTKQLNDLLLSMPTLKSIDVTGQCISDSGLKSLESVITANKNIEEIYFDGSHSNVDSLFEFCQAVINSELKFASYPSEDFRREIDKLKNKEELTFSENFDQVGKILSLESQLAARFQLRFPRKTDVEPIWMRKEEVVCPITQSTSKSSINESSIPFLNNFSMAPFFNAYVVNRDKEMEELFKEAIDTESDNFREAIYKVVDKIDDQLSFRKIMTNC